MKLRTRLATLAAMLLLLLGLGASQLGPSAAAAPTSTSADATSNNGCVVIRPIQTAICIPRF